ncbi:hypothetical protein QQ020_13125 [Fulvivirgaceae bacterium BMA12]|uniref:Uncharacterized protein n=1 Tax=Agaribacillus aureus TaxID=3051825 RepID=A0ABT8L7N2_9BACT|nr:hypothetical protein [Fulvivirgaceae bacterium BMA12]
MPANYHYWYRFILLPEVNKSNKLISFDELTGKHFDSRSTRHLLGWLRRHEYIKEITKDDISYFKTTLKGELLVDQYDPIIKKLAKPQKEEQAKKAFEKIKPLPLRQLYHRFRDHYHRNQALYWIIGFIVAIFSMLFAI